MKKIVYVLSLLFIITACNGDNTTFENNAYKLRNAKNGAEITLGFDGKDKRFFGRSAINRYFGTYKTEDDRLTFGPAGSTKEGEKVPHCWNSGHGAIWDTGKGIRMHVFLHTAIQRSMRSG